MRPRGDRCASIPPCRTVSGQGAPFPSSCFLSGRPRCLHGPVSLTSSLRRACHMRVPTWPHLDREDGEPQAPPGLAPAAPGGWPPQGDMLTHVCSCLGACQLTGNGQTFQRHDLWH